MKYVERDQWNKLLKIRILKQGDDQWELRCVSDKNGDQVRKGEIVFRGSEEQFKLLLRRLKASDTETTPAGTKQITYQKMIDLANNPKGNYIYVKTKNWNEYKNGKQLTLGENGFKKRESSIYDAAYFWAEQNFKKYSKEELINELKKKFGADDIVAHMIYDDLANFYLGEKVMRKEVQEAVIDINRDRQGGFRISVEGSPDRPFMIYKPEVKDFINFVSKESNAKSCKADLMQAFDSAEAYGSYDLSVDMPKDRVAKLFRDYKPLRQRESVIKVGDKVDVPGYNPNQGEWDDYVNCYRARVIAIKGKEAQVRYLDDGDILSIDLNLLKKVEKVKENMKNLKYDNMDLYYQMLDDYSSWSKDRLKTEINRLRRELRTASFDQYTKEEFMLRIEVMKELLYSKREEVIEISKDVKIGNIILEKGDKIRVLEEGWEV